MGSWDRSTDSGKASVPAEPRANSDDRESAVRDPGRIELAREPPVRLGPVRIEPAYRRVAHDDGREEIVEPRVMQVLVALVRADGQILTRHDLLMSCWHGVVVGEDAIDRVLGRLRRLANGIGDGAFKIETITKVGYRLAPTQGAQNPTSSPIRGSAAAGAPATDRPPEPLLAVLAFDNLSGEPDMAYFSDGVSEEILQTVTRGADLKVIGRGSSFQFRGADKAAAHVRNVLKATHVLDGSVRRSGARVRIAANLIECAGETTIWSDHFERELSDVFVLQDEIATAVAAALKVAFAPAAAAGAVDAAAYTAYLRAREVRNRGLLSARTVVPVIALLREATTLAPRFARAWEFLAAMQVEYLRFDTAEYPRAIKRADVVATIEATLGLDPTSGGAYQVLAQLEPFGRFAEREALHLKAVTVAPNDPTVLTNASLFFAEVGRVRDALELARRAYTLDPMYPWAASWYAATLEYAGRDEECRNHWRDYRLRWRDNELIAWGAMCMTIEYGDWPWFDDLVATAREQGFESATLRDAISWGATLREGDPEGSARRLARARERLARRGVLPVVEFSILYGLDRRDEAFELIEEASFAYMFDPDMRSPNGAAGASSMFNINHAGAMMRDVRFVGLCAKLGLCAYWVTTGRWPDCADWVPYDFRAECRRLVAAQVAPIDSHGS